MAGRMKLGGGMWLELAGATPPHEQRKPLTKHYGAGRERRERADELLALGWPPERVAAELGIAIEDVQGGCKR